MSLFRFFITMVLHWNFYRWWCSLIYLPFLYQIWSLSCILSLGSILLLKIVCSTKKKISRQMRIARAHSKIVIVILHNWIFLLLITLSITMCCWYYCIYNFSVGVHDLCGKRTEKCLFCVSLKKSSSHSNEWM